jgi:hypothetical protein
MSDMSDNRMGLASGVGGAISEGMNHLCAFLAWVDAGAAGAPPADCAALGQAMAGLERALGEILHGGRLEAASSRIAAEDLARVVRLEELIVAWSTSAAVPAELVPLAESCVSALWGGRSWRELTNLARRSEHG